MTVGFFGPLPPARTGVAEYSAALLSELRKRVEVRLGDTRCEAKLYQIGNNAFHREAYELALSQPGVVVLHDATLHHFLLGRMGRDEYLAEFTYNYGEWSRGLGEELWRDRGRAAADPRYFEYGLLRRVAESATAVVVHNPGAAAAVVRHAPGARVVEVPHLLLPAIVVGAGECMDARRRLGVSPSTFLFGVFGHLRESKRLPAVLRVFRGLRADGVDCALLVAGEFVSKELERALESDVNGALVIRVGAMSEAELGILSHAVDACVNLRYPGGGETSGIAMRLMAAGKPVIVTSSPETSRIPETACLRVDAGPMEPEMLEAWMRWLCADRAAGREIGRRGAAYLAEHHRAERVAEMILDVLGVSTASPDSR
ncbi:MAG: glycosyltransferase family 4 protein [Bryobacteraceae bacterium]